MTSKARLEELQRLAAQAAHLTDQSRQLSLRAAELASRWASGRLAPAGRDSPTGFDDDLVGLALDLETLNTELSGQLDTERAHIEAERARLVAILEAMGDAVLVVDAAGKPVLTNRAYLQLVGPDVVGLEDEQGAPLPQEKTPQVQALRGRPFTLTFVVRRADGSRRWCEGSGRPLRYEGETHSVVVIRDITDRTLLRLQDEFLALASHELRTPLTPARGYLELLSHALARGETDRADQYVAAALEQLQRLNTLVGGLLDVGRLRGGRLHLQRAAVDLASIVERACGAARLQEDAPPIVTDLPEVAVPVTGDAGRLEQVVANLLTNAIVHAATPRIEVRLRHADNAAVLEVTDYGRGIAPADLPHLFSRFYQVARPDRPTRGGLGLGLYLVEQLVEAHGGAVTVASVVGTGTTFTVRLPLMDAGTTPPGVEGRDDEGEHRGRLTRSASASTTELQEKRRPPR